ncbi:MAG: DUF3108 domain-containing protein [Thiovulaceae bacterium]|nr:DUF3108 domain-containing protein [Sulfurimonadaceae bacterium]
MKKIVFVFIFMTNLIYASNTVAQYDIDFSVVGTIAKATIERVEENGNYVITLKAHTVGIAARLTKDRKESYISQGSVVGSELVTDVLVVIRETNDKATYIVYKFDHKNKTVQKDSSELKQVTSKTMDVRNMCMIETVREEFSYSSVQNDYYAENDIVSLFFNSHYYLGSMNAGEIKKVRAVGIKTDEGELLITMPAREMTTDNTERKKLPKNDLFSIAINKDYFKNGKGELNVRLDSDGFPSKVTMNDVALYGDVVGSRRSDEVAFK